MTPQLAVIFGLSLVAPVSAADLEMWRSSDARAALIAAFEASDCRLTLTEVSDILFDHDVPEDVIYAERLIRMEPEAESLSFPVVIAHGSELCAEVEAVAIDVPKAALTHARGALAGAGCSMDVAALEALAYPAAVGGPLQDTARRNVVSQLYNRGDTTFRYVSVGSVERLRIHLLTGECAVVTE